MKILFMCIENSNRSQMAEAFAKKHAHQGIEIFSAGSKPGGKVNPKALFFMDERNFDLTTHESQAISDLPVTSFDYLISMGCGDDCPFVESIHFEDWQVPDPKYLSDDNFRIVRDYIEIKVKDLFERISKNDRKNKITG